MIFSSLRAETFAGIKFCLKKKAKFWQKLSRLNRFFTKFAEKLSGILCKAHIHVLKLSQMEKNAFERFFWFRVKKLSRFDDLLFPKAETFAKMTKKRENAKLNARESFCC